MNLERPNSYSARGAKELLYPHYDHRAGGDVLTIAKGDGIRVVDDSGKSYIEGVAGLWCASLGFSNERLAQAAYDQLRTLPYYLASAGKSHPIAVELAEKLLSVSPDHMDRVFFACSGSEANDTAVKTIWYYNNARGKPEKKKIIGRQNGYHGVTIASGSITGFTYNHAGFDLPRDRFIHTMAPNYYRNGRSDESPEDFATRCATELEDLILREGPDTVAAMFMEPIMGTGGMIIPPPTYVEKITAVLRRYDILIVSDEIVCGFGRTGHYWGHEAIGLKPDLITCAKGLSSGYLPISAMIISKEIAEVVLDQVHEIGGFGHNFTYTAHPAPARVALEALRIYDEMNVTEHVTKVGQVLQRELRARFADHPLVGDVRGIGLMAAVELVADKGTRANFPPASKVGPCLQDICQANGLILRSLAGDSIAFCPPVIITEAEIIDMLDLFAISLDQLITELGQG